MGMQGTPMGMQGYPMNMQGYPMGMQGYPTGMQGAPMPMMGPELMDETLSVVEPWVRNGLREAQEISPEHALREAASVTYLIGRGYPARVAHQIVESWWHPEAWR